MSENILDNVFSKNILEGLFNKTEKKNEDEEEIKKKYTTIKPKVKVMPYQYDKIANGLGSYFQHKAKELKADAQALSGKSATTSNSVANGSATQSPNVADKQKLLDEIKAEALANAGKSDSSAAQNNGKKYADLELTDEILKKINAYKRTQSDYEGDGEELDHFSKRYTFDEDKARNQQGILQWTPKNARDYSSLSPEGYFRQQFVNDNRKVLREKYIQEALKRKGSPLTDAEIAEAERKAENSKMWQGEIPSTAIKRATYNRDTKEFKVQFTGNSPSAQIMYSYPDVPPEVVQGFKEALSKGQYFLKNIHDQYTTNPGHKRKSKK